MGSNANCNSNRPHGGRPPIQPTPAKPLGPITKSVYEFLGRDDMMPRASGGWSDIAQVDWEIRMECE